MSSLHTVNKSPLVADALEQCLRAAMPGDAILLIEDGVYAAIPSSPAHLACSAGGLKLYALQADIDARGLASRVPASVQRVDDAGFVALCCHYRKTCSWY